MNNKLYSQKDEQTKEVIYSIFIEYITSLEQSIDIE